MLADSTKVSNLGPQNSFPVPEGILNYNGTNFVSITLWSLDPQGARLGGLLLLDRGAIQSGYQRPALSPLPRWEKRPNAY